MHAANVFDIQRSSYVDGPGIRTTVFLKGCHLACAWCHNPEGRAPQIQRMWYGDKCTGCAVCAKKCASGAINLSADGKPTVSAERCTLCGKCALFCPVDAIAICGRTMTTDEVFLEVKKDIPYYETSGGGITLSGGECLLRPSFCAELFAKCREVGIHCAVDTAGDVPWENFEAVLGHTDLFLYDIKCISSDLHRRFTGVDNARILENYRRLLSLGARVTVRIPMIPECNANDEEFAKIAAFLGKYPPESVELLAYHAMGENKFRALGCGEPPHFSVPTADAMEKYRRMLKK